MDLCGCRSSFRKKYLERGRDMGDGGGGGTNVCDRESK